MTSTQTDLEMINVISAPQLLQNKQTRMEGGERNVLCEKFGRNRSNFYLAILESKETKKLSSSLLDPTQTLQS